MEVNEGTAACVVLSDFARAISSAPASCQKSAVARVMIATIKLKETNLCRLVIVMNRNFASERWLIETEFHYYRLERFLSI